MSREDANLATARRYLESIENRVDPKELAAFFGPGFIQEEFPNRLMPNGARRDHARPLRRLPRFPGRPDRGTAQLRLFRPVVEHGVKGLR
jgi:hypothetical protein